MSEKRFERHAAILLLGPTGAGKTPVGQYLEEKGFWGKRCFHFDFGANLRAVTESPMPPSFLTDADFAVVQDSLTHGTLLENEHFKVSEKIFQEFIRRHGIVGQDMIVLNGLPRHMGQAKDVDKLVDIGLVINLACLPEVVRQRIKLNSGGDRAGRTDDSAELVEQKVKLYHERTRPLLDFYREKDVKIATFNVDLDTTPRDVVALLTAAHDDR